MAEQTLTHSQLTNAVNLVAAMAVYEIADKRNENQTAIFLKFMQSRTAQALYDTQTSLWCAGPSAVAAEFESECKNN